ncbi:MAG: glycosyl transferase [Bryobacteraceae bacterium]|nr:MAG: glycosyl transferase [Bryobacteraceae bacterium]
MAQDILPVEARQAVEKLGRADIVIGIPSYNNGRTIGHVVRAAQAGLNKYFPDFQGVIINSDGGSKDDTRKQVLEAQLDASQLLLVNTPLNPVHRLSFPYHGIPGKGSAFRMIFQMARDLGAKACAVVDSDLRSITPEWFDLLLRPVLHRGYDFVAPYYHRHKYDGTITNSIIYPLTRALYGYRIRQPIGGDFGMSLPVIETYLKRTDWETDVARYGIDIWMTTIAVASGYKVCQSFLGAKLHDAKDPGADLSAMLQQVVGSVFGLMIEFKNVWMKVHGSRDIELFGFRYDVGLDPIAVNLDRMIQAFLRGESDLREIWSMALSDRTLRELAALARSAHAAPAEQFRLSDELWVNIIYEFASAYAELPAARAHLVRSLTPLYLGRVASFVNETREMNASEVEDRIEQLCLMFERLKPFVVERWGGPRVDDYTPQPAPASGRTQEVPS